MSDVDKASPRPWAFRDRWLFAAGGDPLALASGYNDWVTTIGGPKYEEWQANAALIVEAVNNYDTALTRIRELERERDEARQLVIEANNSLYGSQGYFHSSNGGEFDKYHLSRGIEDLKALNRKYYAALSSKDQEKTNG